MEYHYATLSDRVKSIFIDTCFIILLMFLFSSVLDNFNDPPDWVKVVFFVGIWFLYEPICIAYGCTIGQYIMHIRVRKASDPSKRIHIINSYIRYIIKVLLGWLSFLSIGLNQQRQAIHDLAIESVMVKV